ncbi:MAG: ATP-binding cassette domain-containing protein, partial [Candidatus Saccharimonas sp.]|nr:ATP-binding cassette domain-containing protein [Planctomycetaceae bacterium]
MISVTQLTRHFRTNGQTLVAVDHLSFEVKKGEVYGLLGPNGAGKTTTLRMILGLLQPTSGDAVVDGFPVARDPDEVKRRIGLVSATAGLYQWLTPREMLLFFADLYGVEPDRAESRLAELSQLLDISPFLDQRCATLSSGQKQRVTLARALMHDPPVMLLDEPTRGLDVVGTHVVFEYIAQLRSLGKAVV